ncbi:hypothetical protein A4X06_0g9147, partial [Tilletia controversa]
MPEVDDPEVTGWWNELAADLTQSTWSQLLDGVHPSQQSTRAASQPKNAPAAPSTSQSSNPGRARKSGLIVPERPSARPLASGSKNPTNADVDAFFDRSIAKGSSTPVVGSGTGNKRRRTTSTRMSNYDLSSDDEHRRNTKGKGKAKATNQTRQSTSSIRKKPGSSKEPAATTAREKQEMRAALDGRAAESDQGSPSTMRSSISISSHRTYSSPLPALSRSQILAWPRTGRSGAQAYDTTRL